jgi:hypothetical protein
MDLTSHMIAPIALLNTPLTPRTFLRRLSYKYSTRNFFLLLETFICPVLISTHLHSGHE